MNQEMTADEAKRLFMDFISALQDIPHGFRIEESPEGFRVYDSRINAVIEALPVFDTFQEAHNALWEDYREAAEEK